MRWGKDEKFYYHEGSLKNPIFRGEGFTKNQYIGGNCLKRRDLDSLQIYGGT